MAGGARYFSKMDELRKNDIGNFWHDEIWCNQNEENTFIWTDRDFSTCRFGDSSGKRTISLSSKLPIFFSSQDRVLLFLH